MDSDSDRRGVTVLGSLATLRVSLADYVVRAVIDNGPLNVMDGQMMRDMNALARWLAEVGDAVRIVLFESANEAFFISHLDVEQLRVPTRTAADAVDASVASFQRLVGGFRDLDQVTIALVAGRVAGGGSEFLCNLDMRFAVRGRAVFNQVETGLGVIPAGSGSQHLPQLMGRARALEVILGHDDVDADHAERYGWVNRAIEDNQRDVVDRLVRRIAAVPLDVIAAAKDAVDAIAPSLSDGLAVERNKIVPLLQAARTAGVIDDFLAAGGQTTSGEARLGEITADLFSH